MIVLHDEAGLTPVRNGVTAVDTTQETTLPKNRPVHEIRLGAIKSAIWANPTEHGIRYSTTVSRLYKDRQDGQWKDTDRFGRDDLPVVCKVLDRAHSWVLENASRDD